MSEIFRKFVLVFVIVGVFGFYTASVLMMQKNEASMSGCPMGIMSDARTHGSNECISFHLGVMRSLSEALPQHIYSQLSMLALAVLGFFVVFYVIHSVLLFLRKIRARYRQKFRISIIVFFAQVGNWLTLLEKRDSANTLVLA